MIELVADTDDAELGFALYDPAAIGEVRAGLGDWDEKRTSLAVDGRAAIHVAMPRVPSPEHPGTERRIARLCVDEEIPSPWRERAVPVVEGARLQVPSGRLYFSGAFAMRTEGAPALEGERHDTAEIPPGDYRLDIYLADWHEGERERFIEERTEPRDHRAEHRLGCLGMLAIASTCVLPLVLAFGYFVLPHLAEQQMPTRSWLYALTGLAVLWAAVLILQRTPGQRRMGAARTARDAMMLPSVVYVLQSAAAPGGRPAFYHEEARESAGVRRRYGL